MSDPTRVAALDQVVRITRTFDAPREHVFQGVTDPAEVAAWFGPAHVEVRRDRVASTCAPGGAGRSRCAGPTAASSPSAYDIIELVSPS
jgi:uncharacterized protein YndB with AHSA1/START domain